MPYYLVQTALTPEAWASMIKNPHSRLEALRPMVEGVGGKLHFYFFAFGDYDNAILVEYPDNVTAAAIAVAVSSSGSVKAFKTTPLLTQEEGIEFMKKAAKAGYRPPST